MIPREKSFLTVGELIHNFAGLLEYVLRVDTQIQAITKMSEKLCLQWNDFQDNIKNAFGNLRDYTDFADVTLACEDGQQVEDHKVPPFFSSQT